MPTYEFVLREALLFFEGRLSGFDGNFGAFTTSMAIGQEILCKYKERIVWRAVICYASRAG
jgi:hypothetical protein